jgi:hypothetical protein
MKFLSQKCDISKEEKRTEEETAQKLCRWEELKKHCRRESGPKK